jgi:hypothetical protein
MDITTTIIIAFIAFNVTLVALVTWFVPKAKLYQKRRQQTLIKLAKEKEEVSQVNGLKDQLLAM